MLPTSRDEPPPAETIDEADVVQLGNVQRDPETIDEIRAALVDRGLGHVVERIDQRVAELQNEGVAQRLRHLFGGGRGPAAIAMQVSQAEKDQHAALRQRSYELAVQRGHIRR